MRDNERSMWQWQCKSGSKIRIHSIPTYWPRGDRDHDRSIRLDSYIDIICGLRSISTDKSLFKCLLFTAGRDIDIDIELARTFVRISQRIILVVHTCISHFFFSLLISSLNSNKSRSVSNFCVTLKKKRCVKLFSSSFKILLEIKITQLSTMCYHFGKCFANKKIYFLLTKIAFALIL